MDWSSLGGDREQLTLGPGTARHPAYQREDAHLQGHPPPPPTNLPAASQARGPCSCGCREGARWVGSPLRESPPGRAGPRNHPVSCGCFVNAPGWHLGHAPRGRPGSGHFWVGPGPRAGGFMSRWWVREPRDTVAHGARLWAWPPWGRSWPEPCDPQAHAASPRMSSPRSDPKPTACWAPTVRVPGPGPRAGTCGARWEVSCSSVPRGSGGPHALPPSWPLSGRRPRAAPTFSVAP